MNDIRDQFHRAAGADDPSLDATDLVDLTSRARSRQHRRRAGVAGLGLAAVALLGLGVVNAGADHPSRQQLTASAGDGGPGADDTTSTVVADTSTPPITWQVDPQGPASTAPDTTAPVITAPESIVPTTPPTDGTAGVVSISGTFRGTSPITGGSEGHCEQLIHVFDATMSLTGGGSWAMHEDYCGWLDGNMWNGKGTFTLTAASGDTLTGTFTSRAPIPTSGEPYQLTITGGTGAHVGASGTCNIDNHLRSAGVGLQEQYGTFTCNVALPSTPVQ